MSPHGASLIQDLGIVVAGAAIASTIFRKLKLPVIFAYLTVGLLLGDGIMPVAILSDEESIHQISQLGVLFLLFFMGMEFDLGRLRRVMGAALMALVAQTLAMLYLARLLSPLMGWDNVSSLFFGSLLAISSTMVTMRVLHEQKRDKMPHAQLAVGIMILEDLLAVLLLVLLSGVAVTKNLDWQSLELVSFMMGVFVIGMFFIGRLFAPKLIAYAEDGDNREALTIVSAGLALGIGALAIRLHFSEALGAFVAGAIISRTRLVHTVLNNNRSLRDLFSAVFFVTIGLQIDPVLVLGNIGWVLFISVLMIVGKISSCFIGLFLSGQAGNSSYRASVAKAQIGEFSFIIAALGKQLGVTDERLTAIAFGVALISILLTPYLSVSSSEQYKWFADHMPRQITRFAKFYRNYLDTVTAELDKSRVLRLTRRPLIQITIYFFLISGIVLGGAVTARWVSHLDVPDPLLWGLAVWICTAILSVPFVIATARNISSIVYMVTDALMAHNRNRSIMQGRVNNLVNMLATLLLLLVLGGFFLSVAAPFLPRGTALILFAILVVGIALFFWRNMVHINSRIEALFIDSFNDDGSEQAEQRRLDTIARLRKDYPWPVEIREIKIGRLSEAAGKALRELNLQTRTGSMILALVRSGIEVFNPGPDTYLFPDDTVVLLGPFESNQKAADMLSAKTDVSTSPKPIKGALKIERVILPQGSSMDGDTLAGLNLRKRFGISVIGIQRGARQITSPGAEELLKSGDMLIYVGSEERSKAFRAFIDGEKVPVMDEIPPPIDNS
ncbi:MAG: cation:proton antiporter [Opitutales bacterium]|nr:cation:proton antiporter [Opitutales bacterium]